MSFKMCRRARERATALLFLFCALHPPMASAAEKALAGAAVLTLDPALAAIVSPGARLRTLIERNTIFDGPAWVRNGGSGYLIFSDVPGNAIDILRRDGRVTTFLRDILPARRMSEAYESLGLEGQRKFPMPGADGITLDPAGSVVYCSYSAGQIVRLEADGRRTVLADRFAGWRLNAPNDLVYASDGALYFTDSRAATRHVDGQGVPYEGLYVLRAGKVLLLSARIDHPNGVAFSPHEHHLYVTDTRRKRVLRFDVRPGGIANEQVFVDMRADEEAGAPDGIKVDRSGNVYATGPGGVWIVSAAGKHIGTIRTPRKITNLAFGDPDHRSVYMTAFGALYRIRLNTPGR